MLAEVCRHMFENQEFSKLFPLTVCEHDGSLTVRKQDGGHCIEDAHGALKAAALSVQKHKYSSGFNRPFDKLKDS
jgi:hypothetical protein